MSQSREGKKSPPKVSHSTLVFLPSEGASYDWDMVTASCGTLSSPLPAQPLLVLNSLLRSLRESHSYSHFPEASAAHSVSAVPNGEGGLVFQTRNIQTWINNLPMTLNKYCPQCVCGGNHSHFETRSQPNYLHTLESKVQTKYLLITQYLLMLMVGGFFFFF